MSTIFSNVRHCSLHVGAHPFAPREREAAGDGSGRYSVLRDDKDTGCMLTLSGGGRAQLAPACRDNGIVVFDPVKWAIDHGRLALTARRGTRRISRRTTPASGVATPRRAGDHGLPPFKPISPLDEKASRIAPGGSSSAATREGRGGGGGSCGAAAG